MVLYNGEHWSLLGKAFENCSFHMNICLYLMYKHDKWFSLRSIFNVFFVFIFGFWNRHTGGNDKFHQHVIYLAIYGFNQVSNINFQLLKFQAKIRIAICLKVIATYDNIFELKYLNVFLWYLF